MAGQEVKDLAIVDPEFEAYLKSLPAIPRLRGDIPTLRKTLADAKRRLNEASQVTPGTPDDIVEEDFHVVGRDGHQILVRAHKPKSQPASGSPLIVVYHGGGYCLGDLSNEEANCRNFARRFGAVCLNVDYRLGPEHKFPAAIDDSWDVLKWASSESASLGADPSRGFLVFGTSAGASIAVIMSHLARDEGLSPQLTGVGLSIPLVFDVNDPPAEYKSHLIAYEQNKDAPILDMPIMRQFVEEYGYDPTSKLFSPFAGEKSTWNFAGLPPTAFWVCGMDPLRDDGIVYDQVLREHGTKTRFKMYPGVPHGFWTLAPTLDLSKKMVQDFIDGIGWLLEQK